MRNIRRAALAGATALAISLTGVVAHAADEATTTDAKEGSSVSKVTDKAKETLGSSNKDKGADASEAPKAGEKKDQSSELKNKLPGSSNKDKKDGAAASEAPKAGEAETKNILGSSEVGSSNLGKKLEGDKAANGRQVFGSSTEKDSEKLPKWANIMKYGTVASVITAFLGLVVFPVYNFLKFNGFIR